MDNSEKLVEELRRKAKQASDIARQMAEEKSLRQSGNNEGRTDLYMWPKPDETVEGRAADFIEATLSTQAAEIERLRAVLERTDDFIVNELAGEMPTMDFCQANPEAGSLLLEARQALSDTSGSADNG